MKVLVYTGVVIASVSALQADADLFAGEILKLMQNARQPHSAQKPNDPSKSTLLDRAQVDPSTEVASGPAFLIDSPKLVDHLEINDTSVLKDAAPSDPVRGELQRQEDKQSLRLNGNTMPLSDHGLLDEKLYPTSSHSNLLVQANNPASE